MKDYTEATIGFDIVQFSICDVSIFGDYVSGNTLYDGNLSCSNSPELNVCDGDVIPIDEEFEDSNVPDPEDDSDDDSDDDSLIDPVTDPVTDPDPEEDPGIEDEEDEDLVTDHDPEEDPDVEDEEDEDPVIDPEEELSDEGVDSELE